MRFIRRIQRHMGLHLFVVHARALDAAAPDDPLPTGCSARLMTQAELLVFSQNHELGLSEDSIVKALARGDICVGYVEHGDLVAYTWSAGASTPMEAGLWVRFGEGYSYGYKAMTLASHRGRHLQECLVHVMDRWLTAHGYRYNIDYIHTDNLPSIVADRRYGNRPVGYAGYVKWFNRIWTFRSAGVKSRGFKIYTPQAPPV